MAPTLSHFFEEFKTNNLRVSVRNLQTHLKCEEYDKFLVAVKSHNLLGPVLLPLAANGHTSYIECILGHVKESDRLDVCRLTNDGRQNLLHRAAAHGKADVIAVVLTMLKPDERGALVTLHDASEFTALDYAIRKGKLNRPVWEALQQGLTESQQLELHRKSPKVSQLSDNAFAAERIQIEEAVEDMERGQNCISQLKVATKKPKTLSMDSAQGQYSQDSNSVKERIVQAASDTVKQMGQQLEMLASQVQLFESDLTEVQKGQTCLEKRTDALELSQEQGSDRSFQRVHQLEAVFRNFQVSCPLPSLGNSEVAAHTVLADDLAIPPADANNIEQEILIMEKFILKLAQHVSYLRLTCQTIPAGVPESRCQNEQEDSSPNSPSFPAHDGSSSSPNSNSPSSTSSDDDNHSDSLSSESSRRTSRSNSVEDGDTQPLNMETSPIMPNAADETLTE